MKTIALALVSLAFAASAPRAAAAPVAPVVKVQSERCASPIGTFNGSGLLFKRGGKGYVLTSEHVVLHDTTGICHRILVAGRRVPMKLLRVDFAVGLAVLETSEDFGTAPDYSDLTWKNGEAGEQVVTLGFPAQVPTLRMDPASRVADAASQRHLFPGLPTATEISGLGEFGMSGGPVLGQPGADGYDRVVGVLSHQYIQLVSGGSSVVRNIDGSTGTVERLLLIPADVAKDFVEGAFAGSPEPALFVRDPESQYAGKDVVHADGLRFEFVKAASGGGGGGGGVGGIGGIDPVGIGGSDQQGDELNQVRISLSRVSAETRWFHAPTKPWVDRVKRRLLGRATLDVIFMARNNRKVPYGSLAKFFLAISAGARPVLAADPNDPVLPDVLVLKSQAGVIEPLAKRFLEAIDDTTTDALLRDVRAVAALFAAGEWGLVDMAQLTRVMDAGSEPWTAHIFPHSFDDAVKLLTALEEAKRALQRLNLE